MQVALVVKNLPASAGDLRDMDSIPGSEDLLEKGTATQLQYCCLENPMDRGTWWATVHRVTQSWTPLKQLGTRTLQMQSLATEKSKRLGLVHPPLCFCTSSTFIAKMDDHFRNEGYSDAGMSIQVNCYQWQRPPQSIPQRSSASDSKDKWHWGEK